MKKNLIAIIALTAALAASTSAFADTVQISEEELNKPVSTYAPDAMPTPEIQGDITPIADFLFCVWLYSNCPTFCFFII